MESFKSPTTRFLGLTAHKTYKALFRLPHIPFLQRIKMKVYEVVFCREAEQTAHAHLLQHFQKNHLQEDLCFALWRPSTGKSRYTGIIYKIILPEKKDRELHGNVDFSPQFLSRSINLAIKEKAGLAFMHSHPSHGWQDMSDPDIIAERDVLTSPAFATGLPLLGLTIGTDGYWSARFWKKERTTTKRYWCQKVRVLGKKSYKFYYNDNLLPPSSRKEILKRTFDTWGPAHQNNIARLKVGIVGLGSVGCIVAEAMARLGVSNIVLIDPDKVEMHNLDRLLYGTTEDIGKYKVNVAGQLIKKHSTAKKVNIKELPFSIHHSQAYYVASDCDFLFSCVDRPVARDVLNFISIAHLIPVIDGGIQVTLDQKKAFYNAHWRSHLVTPYHQCLRCNKQYTTSEVSLELDGSLDDPSYINNLPKEQRNRNQNVFPFSLAVASDEVNMMIRYIIAKDWWPEVQQQDYQFLTSSVTINNNKCSVNCVFQKERVAMGDKCKPHYIISSKQDMETEKQNQKTANHIASFAYFKQIGIKIIRFVYKGSWKK